MADACLHEAPGRAELAIFLCAVVYDEENASEKVL